MRAFHVESLRSKLMAAFQFDDDLEAIMEVFHAGVYRHDMGLTSWRCEHGHVHRDREDAKLCEKQVKKNLERIMELLQEVFRGQA